MIYNVLGQEPLKVYSADEMQCLVGYNNHGLMIYQSLDNYLPNRHVVFEDDFNAPIIDENNWYFDIGALNNSGEAQYYKKENASVDNSCLILTAKKETVLSKTWTSARVTTAGKNGWRHGRFEAKIKFPGVVGAFPAFWLMGLNHQVPPQSDTFGRSYKGSVAWPYCGELDIIEYIPGNTKRPVSTVWPARDSDPYNSLFQVSPNYDVDSAEWHVYAVEITDTSITFYIDGAQIGNSMILSNYVEEDISAYHEPLHILLNLAIKFGEPTVDIMKMYIDWVRVYAPEGIITDIQATEISLPDEIIIKSEEAKYVPFEYFVYPTFTPPEVSNRNIKWYTSDPSIIECDSGVIKAHANGEARLIAVSDNGRVAIADVTVQEIENT